MLNFCFRHEWSLYWLFLESDVYFMSIVCGRPQGRESGPCGRIWTEGGVINLDSRGRHKWMTLK